jgi:hypothetical protein
MKKNKLTSSFLLFITTSWAKQDSLTKIVRYRFMVRGNATKQITYKNDHDLMILPDHLVSMYDLTADNLNHNEEIKDAGFIS